MKMLQAWGIVRFVTGVYDDPDTNWLMGECYASNVRQP